MSIQIPDEVLNRLPEKQRELLQHMSTEEETAFILSLMGKSTKDLFAFMESNLSRYREVNRTGANHIMLVIMLASTGSDRTGEHDSNSDHTSASNADDNDGNSLLSALSNIDNPQVKEVSGKLLARILHEYAVLFYHLENNEGSDEETVRAQDNIAGLVEKVFHLPSTVNHGSEDKIESK